jgi:hypothetical protein
MGTLGGDAENPHHKYPSPGVRIRALGRRLNGGWHDAQNAHHGIADHRLSRTLAGFAAKG